MKTKEELLKIYSAYLPYEIDFRFCHGWSETIMRLHSVCFEKEVVNDNVYLQPKNIEPILYSMDMLTKEIEHKGKNIIMIDVLFQLRPFDDSYEAMAKYIEDLGIETMPYWLYNILLEYHFNVFGLEESEYIKKESLNRSENPNS